MGDLLIISFGGGFVCGALAMVLVYEYQEYLKGKK